MDAELRRRAEAWQAEDPDPETARELGELVARGDVAELTDRFGANLEFGTAGLRGVLGAGPNRMNRAVVRRTTAGLARYLLAQQPDAAQRGVVVARDGRRMSAELAADTAGVLAAHGIPAHVFEEVTPTPLAAFAVLHLGAAAGVVVTASHNPPEYNGFKVYWGNGGQIVPPHDAGITAEIDRVGPARDVPLLARAEAEARGRFHVVPPEVGAAYLEAIDTLRLQRQPDAELSIVYTAMHGVGGRWAEAALRRAGFQRVALVAEQQAPDGRFPTVRFPNPEEPGALDLATALAERERADVVLANDPDADRLAVMARDANGRLRALTGNELGVLLGHYLLTETRPLPDRPLVISTVVSSTQLRAVAEELGALHDETLTGFKWVVQRAQEREAAEGARFLFGYEEALGYTVGTVVRDKDGIGAALLAAELASFCRRKGQTLFGRLEEIHRRFGLHVSFQHSITRPGLGGAKEIAAMMERLRAAPPERIGSWRLEVFRDFRPGGQRLPPANMVAFELEGGARILARPSGTEPKVKFYFELREPIAEGEAMSAARGRAEERLRALVDAFVALAVNPESASP